MLSLFVSPNVRSMPKQTDKVDVQFSTSVRLTRCHWSQRVCISNDTWGTTYAVPVRASEENGLDLDQAELGLQTQPLGSFPTVDQIPL